MNPDLLARIEALEAWMQQKQQQQITAPLDEASRNSLGAPTSRGAGGNALTQTITVSATPASFNVPAAYKATIVLEVDGVKYEIPYIATP